MLVVDFSDLMQAFHQVESSLVLSSCIEPRSCSYNLIFADLLQLVKIICIKLVGKSSSVYNLSRLPASMLKLAEDLLSASLLLPLARLWLCERCGISTNSSMLSMQQRPLCITEADLRPCHTVQFFLQLAMQFYS